MASPVFTIGLTGGIASGKSHVAKLFENRGIAVLDADQVSRQVVAPPSPVLDRIAARFGADILDQEGRLDRPKLRALVFADKQALHDLEAITHPAIREHIARWRTLQSGPYCMIANAILIESGMDKTVDRVLVVDASERIQLARLLRRDNQDEAAARRMMSAQATRAARLRKADDVIGNDDETLGVDADIERLHRLYTLLGNRH